jgi:hypothetical protein
MVAVKRQNTGRRFAMSRKVRSLVVALVLFTFAGGAAQAFPRTIGIPERAGALAAAWEWVASFFAPAADEGRVQAQSKELDLGLGGSTTEASANLGPGFTDRGAVMDPDGAR